MDGECQPGGENAQEKRSELEMKWDEKGRKRLC